MLGVAAGPLFARATLVRAELVEDRRMLHLLQLLATSYPGASWLHPTIHFARDEVAEAGGWHDIAGALTHNGVHHIFQGTGWNHAVSTDLVHWKTAPKGPDTIHETYAGMDSESTPCSGFVTKDPDDNNKVCAGFRQCGSNKGVAGGKPWDVPLELRCALADDLSSWSTDPEYLFNVSFYRAVPYDPARPWKEADGLWYQLMSFDWCNFTTRALPCEAGGMLAMWKSPALRGANASWEYVGPVFTSDQTVLPQGHLVHEFVTIDYIGAMKGDPAPEGTPQTRLFFNNVGGNGGGEGCCSGTTSYFSVTQAAPGAPLLPAQGGPGQDMVDWGAFGLVPNPKAGEDWRSLLDGTKSRGFSMARTLGSEEADQVTKPGRRVMIGWVGPVDGNPALQGRGASAQSLSRDLSLNSKRELLQAFVPELQMLRGAPTPATQGCGYNAGLAAEVLAFLPGSCGDTAATCGVSVLGDGTNSTSITLRPDLGLVLVDAMPQGNTVIRGGPLPPADATSGGWSIHAILDHSIIEVIVNNRTAFTVYAAPSEHAGCVSLLGKKDGATIQAWPLKPANNQEPSIVEAA